MTEQEIRDDERAKIVGNILSRVVDRKADDRFADAHNTQNTEVIRGIAYGIRTKRF